ncbi:MAG: glycosyltransferase [Clostridia bacterium]|nr:glycosyltransferase [Clostridia bacterium]
MFNYQLRPGRKKEMIKFERKGNSEPQITIITAYFNGDRYIDETINSVLNQTFPDWEWIIVNDGSTTEESIQKLKEIEKIDKRIKVVSKENSGLAATRDYGANLANENSKYLFFLDDDDLINRTYLECAYWTLQTNQEAAWAYSDVVNFEGEEFKWIKWFDSETEKEENLLVATALIRKDDFFEVNGYELREKAVNEDWNLWLKLLAKGKRPVRMNFDGFWYRRKLQNSELQRSKQNRKRALEIVKQTGKQIKGKVEAFQYPKQDYNWELIQEECTQNVTYQIEENGKINILMIIPWMVTGGADKFNLDLITRINKDKFNIIMVTTQPSTNEWRQEFEEQTIIYDLTTFLEKKYWVAFIQNLIKQYRIDIVFNTNSLEGYSMIPYLKAKNPEIPIMDYVHMEEWYNRSGGYSRDSSLVSSCIDKTLVCNQNSEKILIDHFGRNPEEVGTVYIGVDEKKFNPQKYEKEAILKEFQIQKEENKYIISCICRISEQKRPMLLVEILRELKNRRQDFIAVIAGDGPMLEKVKAKIRRYGLTEEVVFLGNVKETEKVYQISDLTINCSIKEGLALTAYESLAMGVPVVTANVGGQAELIHSEVGVVVPCMQKETEIMNFDYKEEEIASYVQAIDKVLKDLENYKKNCRNRILNGFTIDHMIVNMEKQLEELVTHKNQKKIETGKALANATDICKELITKTYVAMMGEYEWLCNQVNMKYFKGIDGYHYDSGYDYFETPMGKLRLKVIKITKKLHLYETIKSILRRIRKS